MSRRSPKLAQGVVLLVAVSVGACRAQVLAFDQGDAESPKGGASTGSVLDGLETNTTIAELTDGEATQVCAWLIASYPDPNATFCNEAELDPNGNHCDTSTPGYQGGGTIECNGFGGRPIEWVLLSPERCVLNLRHGPCAATLGTLETCVGDWTGQYAAFETTGDGKTYCDGIRAACAAFANAPSCDETVFQTLPPPATGYFAPCDGKLPIEAGVSCPTTPDGG